MGLERRGALNERPGDYDRAHCASRDAQCRERGARARSGGSGDDAGGMEVFSLSQEHQYVLGSRVG